MGLLKVGESTLGSLARREALLLSCLGLAAAVGTLARFAAIPALELVALLIAVAGMALRVMIAFRRSEVESEMEEAERARRTRVPICSIDAVDPTQVGVDAAPPQGILAGGSVPTYVPREVDGELGSAIDAALGGDGAWIVVAVGPSKVGKSRALFEALSRCAERARIDFVAPVDAEAVVALSTPGEIADGQAGPSVLWLDDLEPFINQGLSLKSLREWHERYPNCVVAATYGGKGSEIVNEAGASGLATVADEILQQSEEVLVSGTSAKELDPLRGRIPDTELRMIEQHGLAAYLVAGPKLQRKLGTGIHSPGEPSCPEGVAIVYATVDWARCGRTDPISEEALRGLWKEYLPPGLRPTDDGFDKGLAWAMRPVAGSIALIEHVNSYRAYDYVVRFVEDAPGVGPPPDVAWRAVLADPTETQAVGVGISAFQRKSYAYAAEAFRIGRASPIEFYAAIAGVNLGTTLRELGQEEEALEAYEHMAQFEDSESAVLREGAIYSSISRGAMLLEMGREEEALEAFDQVLRRYEGTNEQALRAQVARALFNKGLAFSQLERLEEAFEVYDSLLGEFGADQHPEIRKSVADALFNRAVALTNMERLESALETYDELLARLGADADLHLLEVAAKAMFNKANLHGLLGQMPEAMATLDASASAFHDAPAEGLRGRAADALLMKTVYLGKLERYEEELAVYDGIVAGFGDERNLELRESVVEALLAKARRLMRSDRLGEAVEVYERALVRLETERGPTFQEFLARALRGKADALGLAGRHEEELAVYDEIVARLGGAQGPEAAVEAVAVALYNKGTRRWMLEDSDSAIEAFDAVVAHFGDADNPKLREVVARALINKAAIREKQDSWEEAVEVYGELISRFREDPELPLREEIAKAMFNQAWALGRIECGEEAATVLDQLLADVGNAPEERLREVAQRARELRGHLGG